ncbi:MAG: lamin tail domain-containing protein [Myxococcales bacterium]|nr:lamin tail domain-containing protein [Myxococcales bacterium]
MRRARWLLLSGWLVWTLPSLGCGSGVPARIVGMDDRTIAVGEQLELTVRGTVPGEISLESPVLADAQVTRLASETATAIFRWVPVASDVGVKPLTFALKAGGQSATESVVVTVVPSEAGRPRFLNAPYNILLDLSQSQTATLPIAVKDDDNEAISLAIVGGTELANATLDVMPNGKTAMFTFSPTPAQLADRCSFGTQLRARDPGGLEALAGIFIEARNGCGAEPGVLINEVLYDPPTGVDPNRDGTISTSEDEFVELVNISGKAIELGGATISDAVAVRFTFPTPTTLQPGDSAVVFGGGTPQGFPARVKVFAAPSITGGLSLNNSGDTVTLRSSDNAIIDSVTYPAACVRCTASIGTSINRQTDLNRNTLFVGHDLVQAAVGKCSPGARANGTAF